MLNTSATTVNTICTAHEIIRVVWNNRLIKCIATATSNHERNEEKLRESMSRRRTYASIANIKYCTLNNFLKKSCKWSAARSRHRCPMQRNAERRRDHQNVRKIVYLCCAKSFILVVSSSSSCLQSSTRSSIVGVWISIFLNAYVISSFQYICLFGRSVREWLAWTAPIGRDKYTHSIRSQGWSIEYMHFQLISNNSMKRRREEGDRRKRNFARSAQGTHSINW